jgi:hypothetical protein
MIGRYRLKKETKHLNVKKEDARFHVPANLGLTIGGQRLVEIPTRTGYHYARIRGDLSEVVNVYNAKTSPVYDLPVIISFRHNRWEVDDKDTGRYQAWGSSAYLPRHGAQHSFDPSNPGGDVVWVWDNQIMPLAPYPSGSNGAGNIIIERYPYWSTTNSQWQYAGATGTPDLLAYKPTGSNARMVLVYVDVDGNPQLEPGTTFFADNITGSSAILPYMPALQSNDDIPVAGIRLVSGTSTILWNNIYGVRPWFTSAGGSGTAGTQGPPGPAGSGGDLLIFDDNVFKVTGTAIHFVDGLTVHVTGSVAYIDWTGSSGGGHTIQDDGVAETQRTNLNFVGDGFVVYDNAGNDATVVSGTATVFSSHTHIFNEDHSSECDGSTINFSTIYIFVSGTTQVYLNGIRQRVGGANDYVEDANYNGVTFYAPPFENDALLFDYIYGSQSTGTAPLTITGTSGPYTDIYGSLPNSLLLNVHGHTTNSDGSLSPANYAATYETEGHDAFVMTDHNEVSADPGGHSIIYVQGNEITTSNGHMTSLGSNYAPASGIDSQDAIDGINALNGVAILAHPKWTNGWDLAEFATYTNYHGVEIFNMHVEGGVSSNPATYPGYDIGDWDYILTNIRKDVWGIAVDDYHSTSAFKLYNSGRITAFCSGTSASDIIDSMRNGNFVADVTNFGVTPGKPTITNDDVIVVCPGATAIRFVDSSGLLEEQTGITGSYTFAGTEDYVRIEAVGDYTEPFTSALSNRWNSEAGAWTITSEGTLRLASTASTPKMLLKRWREGDFSFQIDSYVSGSNASIATGFVFNALDTDQFYLLRFGKTAGVSSYSNKFCVGVCNGTFAAPFASTGTVIQTNVWYTIKGEYLSDNGTFRAKFWLRDSESEPGSWMIEGTDTTWKHGAFGFRSGYGTIEFDNLYIDGFKSYYQPIPVGDW